MNMRTLNKFALMILAVGVLVLDLMQPGLADPTTMGDSPIRMPGFGASAQRVPTKETSLEDFFPKTDLPYMIASPIDLKGLTIGGLSPKFVPSLGQNLFVVVDNTDFSTMSDVYKDNRLKGKSSFVTVDSVIHPYFSLQNSIMAEVVKEKIYPELGPMLSAMLKVCVQDYKSTEDAEVKEDIQKNMAFLIVALKLLDPDLVVPTLGTANRLAEAELKNISSGRLATSVIFDYKEDFAAYRPFGWYANDRTLQKFYRCRQWLSRMNFPLTESDMSASSDPDSSTKFQQSVLLFRSLDKATINGAPALQTWDRLYRLWNILGARDNKKEQHPLLPNEYKKVFTATQQPLDKMLQGLSEPFFRTKLLLTIRRNKPVELNPTSILKMGEKNQLSAEATVFRFMPLVDENELPWLCSLAHDVNEEQGSVEATPFALLELYGRGSVLATNILAENCWRLDNKLFNKLPALLEATSRKRALSNSKDPEGSTDGRWNVLSHYFKSQIDSAQTPLKTDLWMRRRLESAFAAWVDSNLASMSTQPLPAVIPQDMPPSAPSGTTLTRRSSGAAAATTMVASLSGTTRVPSQFAPIGQLPLAKSGSSSTNVAAASTQSAPAPTATASGASNQLRDPNTTIRPAVAQYLEPAPTMYKSIRTSMQQAIDELNALDCFPAKYKQPCQELVDLCQRFESIALREINSLYASPADARFLGNIDQVLDKISSPVAGTLHLDSNEVVDRSGHYVGGTNLCLGRPGELFILLRTIRGSTLCRGAQYTYYEVPGGPMKPESWARKLDLGLVRAPLWAANFDIIQPNEHSSAPEKPATPQTN